MVWCPTPTLGAAELGGIGEVTDEGQEAQEGSRDAASAGEHPASGFLVPSSASTPSTSCPCCPPLPPPQFFKDIIVI